VRGETLAARIAAQRASEGAHGWVEVTADGGLAALLEVFEAASRGLHVAHEAHLVHRDIKPANIMIDADGQPVVLDFGLARDLEDPGLTATGDVVGTPAYLAPEQLSGDREADRRADVYSLGVTLYESLCLERPFGGATQHALYQ